MAKNDRDKDDIEFLIALGKNLKKLRKSKGLSQDKLGIESMTDASYIRKIERGEQNITILSLRNIAKVLDVDLNEFF
jgi:transcriptional regulator with XRE-family HTH domain